MRQHLSQEAFENNEKIMVFHYDPSNYALLSISEALIGPLDGAPLVPANATTIFPPGNVKEDEIVLFNEEKEEWYVVKDWRGTYVNNKGEEFEVKDFNTKPPEGYAKTYEDLPEKDRVAGLVELGQMQLIVMSNSTIKQITSALKKIDGVKDYSLAEYNTFEDKIQAAKALKVDKKTKVTNAQKTAFKAEAEARGMKIGELATKVLEKAESKQKHDEKIIKSNSDVGILISKFRKILETAKSPQQVESTIKSFRTELKALAKVYGVEITLKTFITEKGPKW